MLGRTGLLATNQQMDDRIANLKAAVAAASDELERATRALAPKHVGGEMEIYELAQGRLMAAEREYAKAEERPFAVLCDFPLVWDVGAPLPTLLQSDERASLFFLLAQEDEQVGKVHFEGLTATSFGGPNDETFEGHPLYGSGFEPYRAMRVINSPWIASLAKVNSVHPYHDPARSEMKQHFIFPFHDTTFECVARSFKATTIRSRLSDAIRDAVGDSY